MWNNFNILLWVQWVVVVVVYWRPLDSKTSTTTKSIEYKIFSILGSAFAWTSVILVIVILLWVSTSTSTLFKFGNILQKYIGTDLQLARLFETGQATQFTTNSINTKKLNVTQVYIFYSRYIIFYSNTRKILEWILKIR